MAGNGSELRKLPALLPFLGGGGIFTKNIYIFFGSYYQKSAPSFVFSVVEATLLFTSILIFPL